MSRLVDISEAARYLEVSEGVVKGAISRGELEVVDRGKHRRKLLSFEEVVQHGIRRNLGESARSQRSIICVGDGLGEVVQSLTAAGLHCVEAPSMLGGIQANGAKGFPILVMGVRAAENEHAVVKALLGDVVVMILARDANRVPWDLESLAIVSDPRELRRITKWCWGMVNKRHEAVTLGLE